MSGTILFADGHEESYPRIKVDDGFAHCFEQSAPPARDDFDAGWKYWLVRINWSILVMHQSSYYHEKSVPESRIEEIR